MKHLLSIEELTAAEITEIFARAKKLKKTRRKSPLPGEDGQPLAGQTWALIFRKASTRTRVSFEVGIRELGGQSLYLSSNEIQLGRGETIVDTARVLSRYVDGVVIRTFAQQDVEEFARYGSIPVVNALTDHEHPCQILADLFTIIEKRGSLRGKKVVFIGDGACNVCNSWLFAAAKVGLDLWVAAPRPLQPAPALVQRAGGQVQVTDDLAGAVRDADVLYTDVWVSMGKEVETAERSKILMAYQINAALLKRAKPDTLVMHCLPAYREKEITADVFEAHQQTIFDQAENRLHVQKAILTLLTCR